MIKSKLFIGFTCTEILILVMFFLFVNLDQQSQLTGTASGKQELVSHLLLTDFAIWTEARYTRHPSQTDFFSPFQDFPSSLEHFPAGSVIAPVYQARSAAR